jgi:probable phosphoglycerate mutase
MPTELILIRHGETEWNRQGRFQGQQDSPLTPEGASQAEAIAAHLARWDIQALYASDLGRTLQTAAPMAAATGLTVIPEPGLRERNLGILEGLTRAEAETHHAEVSARYWARDPDFDLPGGESLRTLERRGQCVLGALAARHPEQRIAVVSHGGLLTVFIRAALGVPLQAQTGLLIRNGSISWVGYRGRAGDSTPSKWLVYSIGEVGHLNGHILRQP